MKKSEFIKLVTEELQTVVTHDFMNEAFVNMVLNVAESKGMLPPCTENAYCKGCGYGKWSPENPLIRVDLGPDASKNYKKDLFNDKYTTIKENK